jgi:plasmid stabilization system protein ParE
LQNPDPQTARRYLEAARPLAAKDLQSQIQSLVKQLAHNPRDTRKVSVELEKILSYTIRGDFRTLLESARAALE